MLIKDCRLKYTYTQTEVLSNWRFLGRKTGAKISMHTRQKLVRIGVTIPFYGIVKAKVRHRDDIIVMILSV